MCTITEFGGDERIEEEQKRTFWSTHWQHRIVLILQSSTHLTLFSAAAPRRAAEAQRTDGSFDNTIVRSAELVELVLTYE